MDVPWAHLMLRGIRSPWSHDCCKDSTIITDSSSLRDLTDKFLTLIFKFFITFLLRTRKTHLLSQLIVRVTSLFQNWMVLISVVVFKFPHLSALRIHFMVIVAFPETTETTGSLFLDISYFDSALLSNGSLAVSTGRLYYGFLQRTNLLLNLGSVEILTLAGCVTVTELAFEPPLPHLRSGVIIP